MNPVIFDTHPTWMELDYDALRENFREVKRRLAPDIVMMTSIKANAYGHGVVGVASVLAEEGVDYFATASFEDAAKVRAAGITTPIVMFGGNLPAGVDEHLRLDLIPSVYVMETVERISNAVTEPTRVFVKVDTGLGRLGVPIDEAEAFIRQVREVPRIVIEGLYTHISFRDDETMAFSRERLVPLYDLVERLVEGGIHIPVIQALDSSFILHDWTDHLSAVCPGHVLYGVSPCAPDFVEMAPFRPMLKAIKSQLIHIGRHPETGPQPGASWYHRNRRGDTGVIPIGLNDGYRKPSPEKGSEMLFRGRRIPVLGVSLEYTVVDLADFEDAGIGEEIVVIGKSGNQYLSLEEAADRLGISPLEFLLSLSDRIPQRNPVGVEETDE